MMPRILLHRSSAFSAPPIVLLVLLCSGLASPAEATTIGFVPSSGIDLVGSFNTFEVSGGSTDGIDFFLDGPLSSGMTRVVASAAGTMGSQVAAYASGVGEFTTTSVQVRAGANQSANVLALASFSTGFIIPTATAGEIVIQIDPPVLAVEGSAQSLMVFSADLNNSQAFFAAAQLNPDGRLITLDAFSDSDFSVQKAGPQTTARLIDETFSIPFHVSVAQVGHEMSFSFGQTYSATAQNGGMAFVENIPEPATSWTFCAGVFGILLFRRIRGGCGW
jgi:hypothetical protein